MCLASEWSEMSKIVSMLQKYKKYPLILTIFGPMIADFTISKDLLSAE